MSFFAGGEKLFDYLGTSSFITWADPGSHFKLGRVLKMSEKSIPQQIYDEFITEISKEEHISSELAESLKALLRSGKTKKKDITAILDSKVKENEDF